MGLPSEKILEFSDVSGLAGHVCQRGVCVV
jgi:hypothetical protein